MAAFPASKLPLVTEILVDGAWIDVTSDRLIEGGLTITRGRRDWASRVVASRCEQAFLNPTGVYSNRNPNSVYFGKLGRGTQLRHRIRWVLATFSGSASNGWALADTGQTWNTNGGAASEYSEGGGVGVHTHPTANIPHNSMLTAPALISDVQAVINVSALATGGIITAGIGMGQDQDNHYRAMLDLGTGGAVQLEIIKRIGGTTTQLATPVTVGSYAAGTRWVVRLQRYANGFWRAAAYLESDNPAQVSTWQRTASDVPTISFPAVVARSARDAANTNAGLQVRYDNVEVNNHRMWGELAASAPAWDLSGKKVTAPFQAAGVLQRLSTGNPPSLSALHRTTLAAGPVAYWSMEDGTDATQFASALVGGSPMTALTDITTSQLDSLPGSESLPLFQTATQLYGDVPAYTDAGQWATQQAAFVPTGADNVPTCMRGWMLDGSSVSVGIDVFAQKLTIVYRAADDTTTVFSSAGTYDPTRVVGTWTSVIVMSRANESGATDGVRAYMYDTAGQLILSVTGLLTATSHVALDKVSPGGVLGTQPSQGAGYGHVSVFTGSSWDPLTDGVVLAKAAGGHVGETASERIGRLCAENGIAYFLADAADTTSRVGVQPIASAVEIMFRAAEADQGILFEPRDALGLAYRPRTSLYDQAGLSLNYAAGHIADPFQPTEDDQILLNDVIAKRDNGSSARVTITDGPLGTEAIGTMDEAQSWNVATDDQLAGIAGWRARQGTWDEARYPTLTVNLAAPDVAGDTALVGAVAALDIGDVATVGNLPVWLPPDDVSLLAEGSTEFFGDGKQWKVTWNCVPAGPWRVYEYAADVGDTNADLGRYEADANALTLDVARDTVQTSWSVASTPLFTTLADDFTPVIRADCEGEEIWITLATGATSPQTLTVQRSKNGVVKSHGVGAPITLLDAAVYVP